MTKKALFRVTPPHGYVKTTAYDIRKETATTVTLEDYNGMDNNIPKRNVFIVENDIRAPFSQDTIQTKKDRMHMGICVKKGSKFLTGTSFCNDGVVNRFKTNLFNEAVYSINACKTITEFNNTTKKYIEKAEVYIGGKNDYTSTQLAFIKLYSSRVFKIYSKLFPPDSKVSWLLANPITKDGGMYYFKVAPKLISPLYLYFFLKLFRQASEMFCFHEDPERRIKTLTNAINKCTNAEFKKKYIAEGMDAGRTYYIASTPLTPFLDKLRAYASGAKLLENWKSAGLYGIIHKIIDQS